MMKAVGSKNAYDSQGPIESMLRSSGSEPSACIAFPAVWFSRKVSNRVEFSVHVEGQLRRVKAKGGGSFNPYGSEGPTSLSQDSVHLEEPDEDLGIRDIVQVRDLEADILDPQYFNLAVWGSEGYRYRSPIRDGDLWRRGWHELEGVTMQGLRTRGLGACEELGEFTRNVVGEVELACVNVRERVVAALPHTWQQVEGLVNIAGSLKELQRMFWFDYIVPVMIRTLVEDGVHVDSTHEPPCPEATIFVRFLKQRDLGTFESCQQDVQAIVCVLKEQQFLSVQAVDDALRNLFQRCNEVG
jgi:hypothetical protein